MIIIGIDPGFASLGWAIVELGPDTERLITAGVIRTQKSAKKRGVLVADDNVRRTREIWQHLETLNYHGRAWENAVAVAVEGQSWPRNASNAAKVAMSWGVIVSLAAQHELPIVQSTPMQVKRAVTGDGQASKEAVIEGVCRHRGFFGKLDVVLDGIPKGQREHVADACAAIISALDSDVVRAARKMLRKG